MASDHSFDIVSKVDSQEILNAVTQTEKELVHRFDLKDANCELDYQQAQNKIQISATEEFKLNALVEILKSKLLKRNVSPKVLSFGKLEKSINGVKQELTLQQGVSQENAKMLIKDIKATGSKVQMAIQGDQVRVSSKKIDDLQAVMKFLREKNYAFHLGFSNLR